MPNGDISNLLYLNEPWRYYYKMCYCPMVVCCTLMSGQLLRDPSRLPEGKSFQFLSARSNQVYNQIHYKKW